MPFPLINCSLWSRSLVVQINFPESLVFFTCSCHPIKGLYFILVFFKAANADCNMASFKTFVNSSFAFFSCFLFFKWNVIGKRRPLVSVQKCHNAPICGLFAKSANLIFKFLSLKISLIQADCHWKQVLVVRSTRFHSLEQSLEILPEQDSDLLTSLEKDIVHCRSQCTLNTTVEQRALALYGLGTYRSFRIVIQKLW